MTITDYHDLAKIDYDSRDVDWAYVPMAYAAALQMLAGTYHFYFSAIRGPKLVNIKSPDDPSRSLYDDAADAMRAYLPLGIVSSPEAVATPLTDEELMSLAETLTKLPESSCLHLDNSPAASERTLAATCEFMKQAYLSGLE